jgi:hypothetical protein
MNIIGVLIGEQDLTRLLPGPPIYSLSVPPSPTGVPFRNVSISLADLYLDVHFVGVLNDGALMHTSFNAMDSRDPMHSSAVWNPWQDITHTLVGGRFPVPRFTVGFTRADCYFDFPFQAETLHVAAVTRDAGLRYRALKPDGRWSQFVDIKVESGLRKFVQDVAVRSDLDGNIHFVVTTTDGELLHGVRSPAGTWVTPFEEMFRRPPPVIAGRFTRIAAEMDANRGDLHVVAKAESFCTLFRLPLEAGRPE